MRIHPSAVVLFALSLGVHSALARAANLTVLHEAVRQSFQNLSDSLDEFKNLPCLPKESVEHLDGFQTNAVTVFTNFERKYGGYMTSMQKPMEGNGRCDGGFQSVAIESEKRSTESTEYSTRVQGMQTQMTLAQDGDFNLPDINISDEEESGECFDAGNKLYDTVKANGAALNLAMTTFRNEVNVTADRFHAYTKVNTGLQGDCGSMMSALILTPGPAAAGGKGVNPSITGKSINPGSTVTGDINESSLADPGSTLKVANPKLKEANGETGASVSPAVNARAEREAAAQSFGSKLGPIASGDNKAEALEMQAFVGISDSGRTPASADAKPTSAAATARQATPGTDTSSWDANLPGNCFDNAKCAGKSIAAARASACPAKHRYFLQSAPGGVCQKLPAK